MIWKTHTTSRKGREGGREEEGLGGRRSSGEGGREVVALGGCAAKVSLPALCWPTGGWPKLSKGAFCSSLLTCAMRVDRMAKHRAALALPLSPIPPCLVRLGHQSPRGHICITLAIWVTPPHLQLSQAHAVQRQAYPRLCFSIVIVKDIYFGRCFPVKKASWTDPSRQGSTYTFPRSLCTGNWATRVKAEGLPMHATTGRSHQLKLFPRFTQLKDKLQLHLKIYIIANKYSVEVSVRYIHWLPEERDVTT